MMLKVLSFKFAGCASFNVSICVVDALMSMEVPLGQRSRKCTFKIRDRVEPQARVIVRTSQGARSTKRSCRVVVSSSKWIVPITAGVSAPSSNENDRDTLGTLTSTVSNLVKLVSDLESNLEEMASSAEETRLLHHEQMRHLREAIDNVHGLGEQVWRSRFVEVFDYSTRKAIHSQLHDSFSIALVKPIRVRLTYPIDEDTLTEMLFNKINSTLCPTCLDSAVANEHCLHCSVLQPRPKYRSRSPLKLFKISTCVQLHRLFGGGSLWRSYQQGKLRSFVLPVCTYIGNEFYNCNTRAILHDIAVNTCVIIVPGGQFHDNDAHEEEINVEYFDDWKIVGRMLEVPLDDIESSSPFRINYSSRTGIVSFQYEYAIFESSGTMTAGRIH